MKKFKNYTFSVTDISPDDKELVELLFYALKSWPEYIQLSSNIDATLKNGVTKDELEDFVISECNYAIARRYKRIDDNLSDKTKKKIKKYKKNIEINKQIKEEKELSKKKLHIYGLWLDYGDIRNKYFKPWYNKWINSDKNKKILEEKKEREKELKDKDEIYGIPRSYLVANTIKTYFLMNTSRFYFLKCKYDNDEKDSNNQIKRLHVPKFIRSLDTSELFQFFIYDLQDQLGTTSISQDILYEAVNKIRHNNKLNLKYLKTCLDLYKRIYVDQREEMIDAYDKIKKGNEKTKKEMKKIEEKIKEKAIMSILSNYARKIIESEPHRKDDIITKKYDDWIDCASGLINGLMIGLFPYIKPEPDNHKKPGMMSDN